jgi:hypothetical protein
MLVTTKVSAKRVLERVRRRSVERLRRKVGSCVGKRQKGMGDRIEMNRKNQTRKLPPQSGTSRKNTSVCVTTIPPRRA